MLRDMYYSKHLHIVMHLILQKCYRIGRNDIIIPILQMRILRLTFEPR